MSSAYLRQALGHSKTSRSPFLLRFKSLRTDTIPLTCCNAGKMKANISFRKSQASKKTLRPT